MKKYLISIIVICLLLISVSSICYAADFQPVISAENGSVGDTITVSISLPENTNAAGGSFNLVYDNTKMELIDATAGTLVTNYYKTINKTYAVNKIRMNFASSETVPASGGVMLNVTFRLIAAGTATISTENFKLADIDTNYLTCADSAESVTINDAQSVDVPTISVINAKGRVGKTVDVTIELSNNPGVALLSFNIGYNSDKMTLSTVTATDEIFSEAEVTPGVVGNNPYTYLAYTASGNKSSNGNLVTLSFVIKDDCSEGDYAVTLTDAEAYNIDETPVVFSMVNGIVTVRKFEPGDITDDGVLNKMDLLRLAKYFAGWDVYADEDAADVTGDGVLNKMDLLRLAKYFAGWDVKLGE